MKHTALLLLATTIAGMALSACKSKNPPPPPPVPQPSGGYYSGK